MAKQDIFAVFKNRTKTFPDHAPITGWFIEKCFGTEQEAAEFIKEQTLPDVYKTEPMDIFVAWEQLTLEYDDTK